MKYCNVDLTYEIQFLIYPVNLLILSNAISWEFGGDQLNLYFANPLIADFFIYSIHEKQY